MRFSGDFAAAETRFRELSLHARTRADKARIYRLMLALHTSRGRASEAVEVGIAAARLYGVRLRAHPTKIEILPDLARVRLALRRRDATVLDALTVVADPSMRELLGLLSEVAAAAFFVDKNLWAQVALSLPRGWRSPTASPPGGRPLHRAGGALLRRARRSRLRPRARRGIAAPRGALLLDSTRCARARRLPVLGAFLTHGQRHLREGVPLLRDAYRHALEVGDLVFCRLLAPSATSSRRSSSGAIPSTHRGGVRLGRALQRQIGSRGGGARRRGGHARHPAPARAGGSPARPSRTRAPSPPSSEASAIKFALHLHVVISLRCLLIFDDIAGARRLVDRSEALLAISAGMMQVPEHHFLAALALLGAARSTAGAKDSREAASLVRRARAHLDALSAFARDCPANYAHKEALARPSSRRRAAPPRRR